MLADSKRRVEGLGMRKWFNADVILMACAVSIIGTLAFLSVAVRAEDATPMMTEAGGTATVNDPVLISPEPKVARKKCRFEGEAAVGLKESTVCRSCHVFDSERASSPAAPNLATIFGRRAASAADFGNYSDGMKLIGTKGLIWDEHSLGAYIKDPRSFLRKITGNTDVQHNMFFKLGDEHKRVAIIAYLRALRACH